MELHELPPGVRIDHTVGRINVNGLVLVLGQTEALISDETDDKNAYGMTLRPKWLMSVHLPPSTMKFLHRQLTELVRVYESINGEIPQDAPQVTGGLRVVADNTPTKTDQPEEPPHQGAQQQARLFSLDWFGGNRRYFDSPASEPAARPDHHPQPAEDPRPEPEPSPSSPKP
jgi:hypothetical protein